MTARRQTVSRQEQWVNEPECLISLLFKIHANKMLQRLILLEAFFLKWITSRDRESTCLNNNATNRWFTRRLFSDPTMSWSFCGAVCSASQSLQRNTQGWIRQRTSPPSGIYHLHEWAWGTFVIIRHSSCSSAQRQCVQDTSKHFGKWK